ncbi:2-phospho-L-lactate guanylyltransferase [Halogeometricum borinquense]|uniref:2-phospho-L-lactate guanylyltransferase n=1 Tax=Halogeometricum borinquense TaxID=60847 RepID=A0A6C0US72_9EURY|nr:2-phospho-L-lactate guanylyltransferase [Halogeometricum borinquense]QIB75798.1 2-phospho-L-lactate guanylyltransferase [Halogeometricum borinquense]QIQ75621.1 2-phospho-L-lactate guanylyltransferase [Halogeometricum borinquense]
MQVVIPYTTRDPKSRLAGVLDEDERRAFARAMRTDVVRAVRAAGGVPTILTTDADDIDDVDAPVVGDDRALTPAVNAVLDDATSDVSVVMADLALVTPDALRRLFESEGEVVIAPGRGGGTNALVVRHPDFHVDYHDASYRDHRAIADDAGLSVTVIDSMRLATDVDEPVDLAEVLLHGAGNARAWLEDAGFELEVTDGRVGVTRSD